MGRRPIQDGLDSFCRWAVSTNSMQPTTAKTYASYIRRVQAELGDSPTQAAVDEFFEDARAHSSSYNNLKAAWKAYADWRAAEGEKVPFFQPPRTRRARSARKEELQSLPESVRQALRNMQQAGISTRQIHQLTWNSVRLKEMCTTHTRIAVPNERNLFWRCSSEDLHTLFRYAQIGNVRSLPLVPETPGSETPYPYRALLREISTYADGELEALIQGKGEEVVGGAALPTPVDEEAELDDYTLPPEKEAALREYKNSAWRPDEQEGAAVLQDLLDSGAS